MKTDAEIELKPEPKHPFVEMIVINSDGAPINTFCGENAPLSQILVTACKVGSPYVKSINPLMPLGQNIYLVDREYAQSYVRTFADKLSKDIEDIARNMPETARYYFVVTF